MSLILDALNRSRREAEQVPGLATAHDIEAPPPRGRGQQRLLLAALLVAFLLIAWLLWERTGQNISVADGPPSAAAPAVRDETAEPAVTSVPVVDTPAAPPAPNAPPAADNAANSAVTAPAQASAVPLEVAEVKAPPVSAGVDALYRQQRETAPVPASTEAVPVATPPAPVAREEEPIDIEELVAAAEAELGNARLAEHPAPFLTDLSQQTKDAIPTLLYSAHDYAGDTGRSSVLINGKELRVGGSTAGVRVEEILPDSVVLSFQGTQFRLRALNSWVNL